MDLIQQCKNSSAEYFSGLFRESVDELSELLIDKTASAKNDRQRSRYLEALKCIKPQCGQLANVYQQALERGFDDFSAGREPSKNTSSEPAQLALVDKSQYEDDVAIRSLATKSSGANSEELWKLNRRFAVARGGKKCTEELNPCGPQQLCAAMRESYRMLDVDPAIKTLLYQRYEQQVLSQAGAHYIQLNKRLAELGVHNTLSFNMVSELKRRAVGGSSQAAVATPPQREAEPNAANDAARLVSGAQSAQESDTSVPLLSPENERRQARVIDAIQAVQQKRSQSGAARTNTMGGASYGAINTDGVVGSADTFTQRELALALGVLQAALQLPMAKQAQPRRVSETEHRLMGELGSAALANAKQKVTAVDADTIDLVGMLFDYMLDDPQLPDGLKSLLSHLHTPYLKVALLDKEFFASASHPARRLLDVMAAAGVRWLREGDDDEKVYQRIRHVVERVINEFDEDLGFFDELFKDFTLFVKVLEKRADLASQRSVEAEKGLDQLRQARDLAEQQIQSRIAGFELPAAIHELLEQPWTDYLVFNYLRHGDSSGQFRSGVAAVEQVVSSIQPQEPGVTSPQLDCSALNAEIKQGFTSLGYDSDKGERLLSALRDAQVQAQEGQLPRLDEQKYASRSRVPGAAITRQLQHQRGREPGRNATAKPMEQANLSAAEQALAEKLSSVSFGTWFEFSRGIGAASQRLKLSWYSSISGNYMFVNHSGVKKAVMALPELLQGMNAGSIIMVERDNKNFFERAISSVLGHLNKS
jgi:hypothetical protein